MIRSIHSIIDRTSQNILKEIILVDDYSDNDIFDKVKNYTSNLSNFATQSNSIEGRLNSEISVNIKVFRTEKREGLIRARIFGANQSREDVSKI